MGRQIHFLQLYTDIHDMLSFLKQNRLFVFGHNGNVLTQPEDMYRERLVSINIKYIPSMIGANSPVEYSVPYPLDSSRITEARFYCPNSPNYELISTDGLNLIREGRFYLSNVYYENDDVVAVYNLLKKYIQKHYIYSKSREMYFSPKFVEEYKNGNVYPAQGTNVFPILDI